ELPPEGKLAFLADQALERKPHILIGLALREDDRKVFESPEQKAKFKSMEAALQMPGLYDHFKKLNRSSLAMWFGEKQLQMECVIGFDDEQASKESRSALNALLGKLEGFVQFLPPPKTPQEKLTRELVTLLVGLKVQRDGVDVRLESSIDMKKVLAMLP